MLALSFGKASVAGGLHASPSRGAGRYSMAVTHGLTASQARSLARRDYGGPAVRLQVSTNAAELARAMSKLAEEQLPFATAVALTRVAQDARDEVRGKLGKTFTLRNKRVEGGIQINRAEKRDWPNVFAEVGTRDDFMARHVTGGVKRPQKGASSIAIPTKITARMRDQSSSGAIPAVVKPFQIRERRTGFVAQAESGLVIRERVEGKKVPFIKSSAGTVYREARYARMGFVTWYLLRRSVRIKASWPFEQQVQGVVSHRYGYHFGKEYEAAMKSARAQFGRFTTEQGRFFYWSARKALG